MDLESGFGGGAVRDRGTVQGVGGGVGRGADVRDSL